jgi:hypothetical protein
MERSSNNMDFHQQLAEFERLNPKVAEAMKLFGVSVEKYQKVLHAMNPPRTYVSNSTTSTGRNQHGR